MLFGLAATGVVSLIALIFYFRNKSSFYKRIFKRVAIYGGLGLALYLVPAATFVDIYYADFPDYANLYKESLADPENQELQKQLEAMKRELFEYEFRGEE